MFSVGYQFIKMLLNNWLWCLLDFCCPRLMRQWCGEVQKRMVSLEKYFTAMLICPWSFRCNENYCSTIPIDAEISISVGVLLLCSYDQTIHNGRSLGWKRCAYHRHPTRWECCWISYTDIHIFLQFFVIICVVSRFTLPFPPSGFCCLMSYRSTLSYTSQIWQHVTAFTTPLLFDLF